MSETTRTGGPAQWDDPAQTRAGFAVFVGRPNVGKSTLTNALVGEKIAITSNRPQTTRHTIRGIVHREDFQLVLVDTPGLHRPRTLLGERLNDLVAETLNEVDAVGMCLPADEAIGPGDRFIAQQLSYLHRTPVVAVVSGAEMTPEQAADVVRAMLARTTWQWACVAAQRYAACSLRTTASAVLVALLSLKLLQ